MCAQAHTCVPSEGMHPTPYAFVSGTPWGVPLALQHYPPWCPLLSQTTPARPAACCETHTLMHMYAACRGEPLPSAVRECLKWGRCHRGRGRTGPAPHWASRLKAVGEPCPVRHRSLTHTPNHVEAVYRVSCNACTCLSFCAIVGQLKRNPPVYLASTSTEAGVEHWNNGFRKGVNPPSWPTNGARGMACCKVGPLRSARACAVPSNHSPYITSLSQDSKCRTRSRSLSSPLLCHWRGFRRWGGANARGQWWGEAACWNLEPGTTSSGVGRGSMLVQ